jgi:hypothetical protein
MTTTTRRAVLAAAPAAVIATAMPAAALTTDLMPPTFAEDGKIAAIGARFECLLLQYFEATLEWSRCVADANSKAAGRLGLSRHDFGIGLRRDHSAILFEEMARNGGTAASRRMSSLERRLMPLARTIIASRETSRASLRAKVLVYSMKPGQPAPMPSTLGSSPTTAARPVHCSRQSPI